MVKGTDDLKHITTRELRPKGKAVDHTLHGNQESMNHCIHGKQGGTALRRPYVI